MTDEPEVIFPIVREGTIGAASAQIVDARDLHFALKAKTEFSHYVPRRIRQLGLEENVDYEVFANFGVNPQGGRPTVEYALTLNAAKHMAMVEKNDMGRRVRNYFLECERRLSEPRAIERDDRLKLALVEAAERLAGRNAALALWRDLGLPPLAPDDAPIAPAVSAPAAKEDAARACFEHLANHTLGSHSLSQLVVQMLAGGMSATRKLLYFGLFTEREEDDETLWLCLRTDDRRYAAVFNGTRWTEGRWKTALAALPGARMRGDYIYPDKVTAEKTVLMLPCDWFLEHVRP